MNLRLQESVILVTGGSDGLGAALGAELVSEGARIGICGRDPGRLRAVSDRLEALGGEVLAVPADVTRSEDAERFVSAVGERWGRIDGIVNNAGAPGSGGIEDVTDEAWRADLPLKLGGLVALGRAAAPYLCRSASASIVNVMAVRTKAPWARVIPTDQLGAASLAMTLAITHSLSGELGPQRIRVNAILIGRVRSGRWRHRIRVAGTSAGPYYLNLSSIGFPLGRIGAEAEFAELAAYLVSDRSPSVTGSAVTLGPVTWPEPA